MPDPGYCPVCNLPGPRGGTYCPSCGGPISSETHPTTRHPHRDHRTEEDSTWWERISRLQKAALIAGAILIVLLLAAVVTWA